MNSFFLQTVILLACEVVHPSVCGSRVDRNHVALVVNEVININSAPLNALMRQVM